MARRAQRIVIVGGGFGGLAAALALPSRFAVTLVDRRPWFEWLPNIHELVSGVKTEALLRLPLDRILRRAGHRFVNRPVLGIDPQAREVRLDGPTPLPYDALLLATGGVDDARGVPGVAEHALGFKSVEQCAAIGRRLQGLAAAGAGQEIAIVGGGFEGVEALGEVLRRWRAERCFRVHVVEAAERLMPDAPAALDRCLRELSEPFDVHVHTGARVARVAADAVQLESGERLDVRATIWTGGPAAPALLNEAGLAPPGQWAPVKETLQSMAWPEIFVAGDAAELPGPLDKQGYHALDMGECAARNIRRLLEGDEPRPFEPSAKPQLVSFGDLTCFLLAGGRFFATPALAAAKEAVYELGMARLDRVAPPRALSDVAARAERALRELLWPAVSSLDALRRQASFRLG